MIRWSGKRLIVNILLFGLFLLAAYYLWFPPIWACQTVRFRGFSKIAPSVLVSDQTSKARQDSLLQFVTQANNRIRSFWGNRQGEATIIFCSNREEYQKFCLIYEGAGCSLGTPTGSWIVLNPDGLNVDVIAHEMCHDELFSRLGWMKAKSSLPQWFDEGMALMVDYRYSDPDPSRRYIGYVQEWDILTNHGKTAPHLQDIVTLNGFFGTQRGQADPTRTAQSYVTSGKEVSRWLGLVGQDGLLRIVQQLRDGYDFEDAYSEIEQYHRPKL